ADRRSARRFNVREDFRRHSNSVDSRRYPRANRESEEAGWSLQNLYDRSRKLAAGGRPNQGQVWVGRTLRQRRIVGRFTAVTAHHAHWFQHSHPSVQLCAYSFMLSVILHSSRKENVLSGFRILHSSGKCRVYSISRREYVPSRL